MPEKRALAYSIRTRDPFTALAEEEGAVTEKSRYLIPRLSLI